MTIVKRVQEIRLRKLRMLIEEHFAGKPGLFADKLGKRRPAIYRLFTDAPSRKALGDKLTRQIEEFFGKEPGWMDNEIDLVFRSGGERKFVQLKKAGPLPAKPTRMPAAYRKEVLGLLEKMSPEQREEARALMRQWVYENVISLHGEIRPPMKAQSIAIRSEGRRTTSTGKALSSRRLSDHKSNNKGSRK